MTEACSGAGDAENTASALDFSDSFMSNLVPLFGAFTSVHANSEQLF